MNERRIFLAFDIPDAVRTICDGHIQNLRNRFPDVRIGWEKAEKQHITLKFLGNTGSRLLEDLNARVSEIGIRHSPFVLRLSRTGVFPRATRPRVLWVGLEDRPSGVQPMYAELESVCQELGWAKETRTFRPHITVGRVRDPDEAAALADVHLRSKIEPVEFEVSEIVIYESKLQPTGSVYSRLASIALNAA
ncbi:MAG TPA: RNA 2',3'-cyclic phosphodiesterase [Pyrinomonadaceae bacterium]|nr:RNA 2',3'-cyclic phosphodiesterase [Pyrinomonadaceae bacterium]